MKILSVGTVAFDTIHTNKGKAERILGGAATYIGLSAAALNIPIDLISIVGYDFPKEYLNLLENKNINIKGIEIIPNKKTFFWEGKYHQDMNSRETLITELNSLEQFNPKLSEDNKNVEILLLGNLHPSVQLSVINQANNPKLIILDTMDFWMNNTWNELLEVINKVNVITINDSEARQLSGEYSLAKAANKIHLMGPEFVIIKKGEHGALLFHNNQIFSAPAIILEDVSDPTGAGDTFAGGFAAYLAKVQDFSFNSMKTAIIYGSVLASFCVEKFGTEKLQNITEKDINERLNKFIELSKFDI